MTRSIKILSAVLLTIGLVLAGCATKVPIYSVVKPQIDTSSVERMAIKPFTDRTGSAGNIAAHLTDVSRQTITNTGKFTMVSPTDPNADGFFTGEITALNYKDDSSQRTRTDSNGNPYTVTIYTREVSLSFTISVISARTDMPIGTLTKSNRASSSSENSASGLKSIQDLAMQIANSEIRSLEKNILPYTTQSGYNTLMKESSKDKVVKGKMKVAQNFAKNKDYARALELYEEIARDYNSFAAKTNADYIRASVSSAEAAAAELDKLFAERGGPIDKAIESVVKALTSALPEGENITIMKSQTTQQAMLDRIVDRLTDAVIQSGQLKVIDRSNQALIAAEQQFQLSGNVSDESAISIGRQLGIKYIVLCWISGEMSERRLYLRALNIETSEITTQDSFEI